MYKNISSLALLTFNAVALDTITIKEKPLTRGKEVCKALEYGEKSKTATIIKYHCTKENVALKY